jgi:hypothetical protein
VTSVSQDSWALSGDVNPEHMEAVLSTRVSKEGPPNQCEKSVKRACPYSSVRASHSALTAVGWQNFKNKHRLIITQKKPITVFKITLGSNLNYIMQSRAIIMLHTQSHYFSETWLISFPLSL